MTADLRPITMTLERGQMRTLSFALFVYRAERQASARARRDPDWPAEERELDRLAATLALMLEAARNAP